MDLHNSLKLMSVFFLHMLQEKKFKDKFQNHFNKCMFVLICIYLLIYTFNIM